MHVLFCANKPLTFLGSLDFSEHFNQMLSKSGGDKISHFKKWWGHVPSVPSVNDTYGHVAYIFLIAKSKLTDSILRLLKSFYLFVYFILYFYSVVY